MADILTAFTLVRQLRDPFSSVLRVYPINLLAGVGFQAFHGRFGRDELHERKRKQQGMFLCAAALALLAAYLQTPLICFVIFPVFVLVWVVL